MHSTRIATLLLALAVMVGGCTRPPPLEQAPVTAKTVEDLQGYLLKQKPDVGVFRLRGPFKVETLKNHVLRVSPTDRIVTDLFLTTAPEKAGVVIFMHGYDVSKEAHEYQAAHMASWGLHAITVQLPKRSQWMSNGRMLARITALLHRLPAIVSNRIDGNKIILVGHSFGATSVAVALGEGAPAMGGILLDPAAIGRDLPKLLQRVTKPVIVLGADETVDVTRNRDWFYRFVRGSIAEVSIRNASHEDAQYPSQSSLDNFGIDPYTSEEAQMMFSAAIVSAALSLSATGGFEQAWSTFAPAIQTGQLFNARKK
ncbi:MAG TPA: alpha/beta fold hydrolase [Burkholderiales bacterium]|nr:alpha/beta fold hydrolase [Burkholderiales bacterium]